MHLRLLIYIFYTEIIDIKKIKIRTDLRVYGCTGKFCPDDEGRGRESFLAVLRVCL